MMAVEQKPNMREALQEMQELLVAASSAKSPPHRLSAVRYTLCRAALLEGELRSALPGFLIQCVSIYKFHDFINLYHPKPEARTEFVLDAFEDCRVLAAAAPVRRPGFDVFGDNDF